ncbi:hypothetical protein [Embleya sp. NBC_00896]|uniref:hypothetical protein n=1 Tax=Embleya sp. NBC_00896 TaxID=2975961 RepID=UPI00386EB331|nr:hypothetical protein OG928_48170 [Embleya sp. NBC_00896]
MSTGTANTELTWTVITPTTDALAADPYDSSAEAMAAAERAHAVLFPERMTTWAFAPTGDTQILEQWDPAAEEWLPTGYGVAISTTSLYGSPDGRIPPTSVGSFGEGMLRMALSAMRAEVAAHVTKWHEVLDAFEDVRCTPGCHGSRLFAPCSECAADRRALTDSRDDA